MTAAAVLEPATGEALFELEETPAAQAAAALERARAAQPGWAALPALERGERLRGIGAELLADEGLAELIARDVGKPIVEARGEVTRAARIFEYYAGLGAAPAGELFEDAAGGQVRVVRRARGAALLITPWNFPLAIPAWKLAPALLAGCSVALKPSTPATRVAQRLAGAVARAGVPDGVLELAPGGARTAGALLDAQPDVVSFTGSTAVGRSIAQRLAGSFVPLQLEMGGKNALYVSDAAEPAEAARIALAGAMGYAGQKCTATSRVYVHARVAAPLLRELERQVAELGVGDPAAETTVVGPLISAEARDRARGAVADAAARGVELLAGGDALGRPGAFLAPTIMRGGDPADPLYRDELFAPVVGVQEVPDAEQGLERINALEYGLVAGIVSPVHSEVEAFAAAAEAGVIRVNAPTTGLEPHVPFGGVKASSFGPREQGMAGLEAFRETRTIYG